MRKLENIIREKEEKLLTATSRGFMREIVKRINCTLEVFNHDHGFWCYECILLSRNTNKQERTKSETQIYY